MKKRSEFISSSFLDLVFFAETGSEQPLHSFIVWYLRFSTVNSSVDWRVAPK
jgi:hypothetical protein